jgi:transcriptional regulator with XRE-family HTH domain
MIRLKLWRLQRRLTQEDAARWIGIGESSYAMLESGRLQPTSGQMDRLQQRFGKGAEALFEPVRDRVEVTP